MDDEELCIIIWTTEVIKTHLKMKRHTDCGVSTVEDMNSKTVGGADKL